MHSFIIFAALLLAGLGDAKLYGLYLAANAPAKFGLATIDPVSGNVTQLGSSHSELAGTGDLTAIDEKNGIFYYLGDTGAGTTLVGLSLKTGAEICKGDASSLVEQGFVGFGQSLDWDNKNEELVMSGLSRNATVGHNVVRTKGCPGGKAGAPVFRRVGTFGDAAFIPMLHASTFDSVSQTLYLTVVTNDKADAIGMIDLKPSAPPTMTVFPETATDMVIGMQWNAANSSVIAVMQDGMGTPNASLSLVSFSPSTKAGGWVSKTVTNTAGIVELMGNEGTVSAFDSKRGLLFVEAGIPQGQSDPVGRLLAIDVKTAAVQTSPVIAPLPLGTDTVNAIEWV